MVKYVELGYPIFEGMPLYPGLPEVKLTPVEQIEKGDDWNATVLSIYLHAGTHVDAPCHYVPGAIGIDQIPIENFIYKKPLMIYSKCEPNHLVTIDEIKAVGDEIYEADILFFNTGYYKYRESDFDTYKNNFPAISPEAAEYIRQKLINVKAVAIDTLSIENLKQGKNNNFLTHNAFLNPNKYHQRTILIYEDYNPAPIDGKTIISAVAAPLRIRNKDASIVNIIAKIK